MRLLLPLLLVVPAAAPALGARGTVFVGSMDAVKIYALTDADHEGRAERVRMIASGLQMPGAVYRITYGKGG